MKKILIIAFTFLFSLMSHQLFACTVFYAAKGNVVLAGNNEDFLNAEAYIQFLPAEQGKHGRIYFGFFAEPGKISPFGGVNDQGLFFDTASLGTIKLDKPPEGEIYKGNIIEKILEECSSVEDALALIYRYANILYYTNGQIMFGDRLGNSVIIERDKVIKKAGWYQIMTNFRQTTDEFKKGNVPCGRYEVANNLLKGAPEISKALFQRIMESVHQEGPYSTVYSNIYDLKNGKIYLYYFHNFFEEVTLDVAKELAKGKRIVKLNSLYSRNIAAEGFVNWKNGELEDKIKTRLAKNISSKITDDYVGKYKITFYNTNDSLEVIKEADRLYILAQDSLKVEILPESETKFFIATLNGDMEFTFTKVETEQKILLHIKSVQWGDEATYERKL